MKESLKWTFILLLSGTIISNVMLTVTIRQITKQRKIPNVDTTIVKKIVAADLPVKHDFVYVEGKIIKDSHKIDDVYNYNPTYPQEIWDGYIALFESVSGAKYFIWSSQKLYRNDQTIIKGWFLPMGGKFESDKDHYQGLIPVVKRNTIRIK